ncbi:MAG: hypothetical protein ACKVQR_13055 [Aquabacterium sp.]
MVSTPLLLTAAPLVLLYGLFLLWYGGRGRPLTPQETDRFLQALAEQARGPDAQAQLAGVRELVRQDDGREFVMQNLVRYRERAAYPPGHAGPDDPREADRRYGRAIIPHLLRCGSLPVFVARRSGSLFTPPGADAWHYVAMVRYRSRRDFLRFALAIEREDIVVHKWAAIEKTHVFPVQPIVSLVTVRLLVGGLLGLAGLATWTLVG